jgi:hypothetical protein
MTARRFGGQYSPGAQTAAPAAGPRATPWSGRRVRSTSVRALGLYVWPTLLLVGALRALVGGDPLIAGGFLGAWAALILGAGLTRAGVVAAREYEARAVAAPPAFPRKLFGAALTGAGVAAAAWLGTASPVNAGLFGALAAALHAVAFWPDPMRSKGLDGLQGEALDAAVTKIETARRLIGEMTAAAGRFGDRGLAERVGRLAAEAEAVVAQLERDPAGIGRARRFLAVYLVGARDAAVKYAAAFEESRDPDVAARYGALVDDLSAQFARHRAALAEGDRTALEVEIDVLRDRLKLEGVQ